MRKIIVFSVVFVLLAGAAFAIDISGSVYGTVYAAKGDNEKVPDPLPNDPDHTTGHKVTSGGELNQVRVEVSGQNEGGDFGGWLRIDPAGFEKDDQGKIDSFDDFNNGINGLAWWKPIKQLKLTIGGNPDGHFGKDGVTRWGFYEGASDVGITNPGNAWGGGYGGDIYGIYGNAFYGGDNPGFLVEITPIEILAINIGIPFISHNDEEAVNILKQSIVQVDLNFDFGNIALTYVGGLGKIDEDDFADFMKNHPNPSFDEYLALANSGKFYLYAGIPIGKEMSIDAGVGYTLPGSFSSTQDIGYIKIPIELKISQPVGAGLGFKFANDLFGVKVRTVVGFLGSVTTTGVMGVGAGYAADIPLTVRFDVLPFFSISDNMRAFLSVGVGYVAETKVLGVKVADSSFDWHTNPYMEIGKGGGPNFLFGVKVWSEANHEIVRWAVPVSLMVSF